MIRIIILFVSLIISQSGGIMNKTVEDQPEEAIISFGLIADAQYCDCPSQGSRFFNESLHKLRVAVNDFNRYDVDFVINLGDLIEKDFASFKPVLDILESSDNSVYQVTGNHDYLVRKEYKKKINLLLTGNEAGYYSFVKDGYRFIFLNTCEISTYSGSFFAALKARSMINKMHTEKRPNAFDWNGAIGNRQLDWFESELEDAGANNEYVLVFSHHTIEPEGTHNIYNRDKVLKIISGHKNVIAWFCGHDHTGNYVYEEGIHFVTLRGMVETKEQNSWAVVDIFKDELLIDGKGREEDRVMKY